MVEIHSQECECVCCEPDKHNLVRFTLPALPPSVNGLYQVIYSQRRVELKPEARRWKTQAKEDMPPWERNPENLLRIDVVFEYPRNFKNGKTRRKDCSNLLKLLIDAVAERYGFDDSLVIEGSWSSKDAAIEYVVVTVSEIHVG